MTISRFLALTLGAILFSGAIGQGDEVDTENEIQFSEAETRLWLTDQLQSITSVIELTYSFEKSGSLEPGFSDQVSFVVNKINDDGTKGASVKFLSGERNFPIPPVSRATVNPILKVYLTGDVYEMNRLTDPNGAARERWRYFQRRIKFALAESATVDDVTFEYDGRNWRGHEVRFQPYVDDPKRNLFARLANKSYSIVVSDELPGYLYRIETIVPGDSGVAQPLLHEVLQLSTINKLD